MAGLLLLFFSSSRPDTTTEEVVQTSTKMPVELEMELPYGTMRADSKFYVERQADEDCKTHIGKETAVTLFVQASRQMGKSSLMHRMLDRASKRYNKKCVFVDFQKFPEEYFVDEEKFLQEFCLAISDALAIPEALDNIGP